MEFKDFWLGCRYNGNVHCSCGCGCCYNGNVPYSYGCNACLIATVGKIVAILVEKLGEDSKK